MNKDSWNESIRRQEENALKERREVEKLLKSAGGKKQKTMSWKDLDSIIAEKAKNPEFLNEFIKSLLSDVRKETLEEVLGMLKKWDNFTCHSRKEHAKNDCPGWSHEDNRVRDVLLSQIQYQIEQKLKDNG